MAIYAKYDAIDGQSLDKNHEKWIDVLSIDWGVHRPGGGTTGQARQKASAIVDDLTMTIDYEKAAPKILESMLNGKVIPKLEIHFTTTYGDGAKNVYLVYELEKVMITSFGTSGSGHGETPPQVVIGNNAEQIKVTYTEYSPEGTKGPTTKTGYNVPKGVKV